MQGLHKSLSCTAFSFCRVVSMQFMSGKGYTVIVCSIDININRRFIDSQ